MKKSFLSIFPGTASDGKYFCSDSSSQLSVISEEPSEELLLRFACAWCSKDALESDKNAALTNLILSRTRIGKIQFPSEEWEDLYKVSGKAELDRFLANKQKKFTKSFFELLVNVGWESERTEPN